MRMTRPWVICQKQDPAFPALGDVAVGVHDRCRQTASITADPPNPGGIYKDGQQLYSSFTQRSAYSPMYGSQYLLNPSCASLYAR